MKHTLLTLATALTFGTSALAAEQAPSYYRAKLGDFDITVLSDGVAPRKVDTILSNPALVRAELAASHLHGELPLSINVFLIQTGKQLVMVDTGAGELFGPESGHLVARLAAAGIRPEQVDVILLTHIHGDHSGGLSIAGKRLFPNATVYVDRKEADHWMAQAVPKATVGPYADAGRLKYLPANGKVLPGITARAVPGHTPGHTGYAVESRGQRMLLWGDTVHVAEVQLAHPEVTIEYDVDQPAAAAARRALLDDVANTGVVVAAPHFSFPGLGHLRKDGNGYRWIALPYNDRVKPLIQAASR
jgi:glyoxylase-like metal-dependent hydrolase (beta-lactamase superfamily II)